MKKILSTVLIMSMISGLLLPALIFAQVANVALNKQNVVASYNASDSGSPKSVTDGVTNKTDANNKWFVNKANATGAWINIDLEESYSISQVVLYSGYNNTNTTNDILYDFDILYCDGEVTQVGSASEYQTAVIREGDISGKGFGLTTVTLNPQIKARNIKIVSRNTSAQAFRIREIEVYGEKFNSIPTIEILPILNDGIFLEGSSIDVSAKAIDVDGVVSSVEFCLDDNIINENVTNSGDIYTVTIPANLLVAGEHTITAKAYDNDLAEAVSEAVTLNIYSELDVLKILNNSTRADVEQNFDRVIDLLSIETSKFQNLSESQKQRIYLKLLDIDFTAKSELIRTIDELVADAGGQTSPPPIGGGGNGGTAVVIPDVKPMPLPSDVEGTKYEKEISLLMALGIVKGYEDKEFKPNNKVTRAEFAAMAAKTMNLSPVGSAKFSDVPPQHWASGYIGIISDMGIINGYDDGTFRPDENITLQEAAKILVSVLGYDSYADNKGGYPFGYVKTAYEIGVVKNVTAENQGVLSREQIACMIYNSLHIDMMKQVLYGSQISFEIAKDSTLLRDKLAVVKRKGVVSANSNVNTDGDYNPLKGQIIINNILYYEGNTNIAKMVGSQVTVYARYEKDDDVETVVYFEKTSKYEEIKVLSDEINSSTTAEKFSYEKDNQTEYVNIPKNVTVIYNGKNLFSFDEETLKPKNGEVSLLMENGTLSIIKITSYVTRVVHKVNVDKKTIYYKENKGFTDLSSSDIRFDITKNGEKVTLKDLAEWDVVSVAGSLDGTVYSLAASTDKFEGSISEKRTENDIIELMIEDKTHRVSSDYNLDTSKITVGGQGTFYLDIYGKIVYIEQDQTSEQYAYLIAADQMKGISGDFKVRLLTLDGKMKEYPAAKKLKLNTVANKAPQDLEKALIKDGTITPQLVKIRANSKNEIVEFQTAKDNTVVSKPTYDENIFSKDITSSSLRYKNQMLSSGTNIYRAPANTPVIKVGFKEDKTVDQDTLFISEVKTEFKSDVKYSGLTLYDLTFEDNAASIIVMALSSGSWIDPESSIAVVDRITQGLDESGEAINLLYYMINGQIQKIMVESDAENTRSIEGNDNKNAPLSYKDVQLLDLKRGDIIQFETNYRDYLSTFRPVFVQAVTKNEADIIVGGGSGYVEFPTFETMYGTITKKTSLTLSISVGDDVRKLTLETPKVYRYNKQFDKLEEISVDDLDLYKSDSGAKTFIHLNRKACQTIVVYD